jgi:threonine dehydrogenase-like Zn-dependent dehydrogenase
MLHGESAGSAALDVPLSGGIGSPCRAVPGPLRRSYRLRMSMPCSMRSPITRSAGRASRRRGARHRLRQPCSGDRVCIIGAGPIGLLILVARASGAQMCACQPCHGQERPAGERSVNSARYARRQALPRRILLWTTGPGARREVGAWGTRAAGVCRFALFSAVFAGTSGTKPAAYPARVAHDRTAPVDGKGVVAKWGTRGRLPSGRVVWGKGVCQRPPAEAGTVGTVGVESQESGLGERSADRVWRRGAVSGPEVRLAV